MTEYETSCFSGKYVSGGATINDEYFTKLHALRNDNAKMKRLIHNHPCPWGVMMGVRICQMIKEFKIFRGIDKFTTKSLANH